VEVRSIRTTTALNSYLNWPGVQQVCEVTRERTIKGKKSFEVVYYITSLSPSKANAEDLLAMIRNHWGVIENGLHYLRDTLYEEDKSTIRTGHSAQNLAALRNTTLNIMRNLKVTAFAKTLREFSRQPLRLVHYL
jgi:predicted transposase YbfD/YdcC